MSVGLGSGSGCGRAVTTDKRVKARISIVKGVERRKKGT
jgi:hypothetical protein